MRYASTPWMRLLRDLLFAGVGALCALALTGKVAASDAVPGDRVVAALEAAPYDWRPDAARAIATEAPAQVGPDLPGAGAYYCNATPPSRVYLPGACLDGGPRVVFYESYPSTYLIDHEYHHAWQDLRVHDDAQMIRTWFDALAARDDEAGQIAHRILAEQQTDVWHLNHQLVERLNWRYDAIPEPYRSTWFAYGRVRRTTFLPLVGR